MSVYISGYSSYKPKYKNDEIVVWSDVASLCINNMLEKYNIKSESVELLISANETSDFFTPQAGCIVREKCKLHNSVVFNLNTGLGGINSAISLAEQYIIDGTYKSAVVVFGEVLHTQLDENEIKTNRLKDGIGCLYISNKKTDGLEVIDSNFCSCGSNDEYLKIRMSGTKERNKLEDIDKGYNKLHSYSELNSQDIKATLINIIAQSLERSYIHIEDINSFVISGLTDELYNIQKETLVQIGADEQKISKSQQYYYFGATQIDDLEKATKKAGITLLVDVSLGMEISCVLLKNSKEE